jgi:hypothetical protein
MPGDNGQPSTGASGAPLATTTRLPPLYYGPGGKMLDRQLTAMYGGDVVWSLPLLGK